MEKRLNEKKFSKDGKLYAFFQKCKGGKVYYCYSDDKGATWSNPKVVKS
jgi:Neuraminidase (sialidase)